MNGSDYTSRFPEKRRLRIYATDPMSGRRTPFRIAVEIDNEPNLKPGPTGNIVEVWDYDGWNKQFYKPVDLNAPALLMDGGVQPSESDPRFHQQMVYAVSMKVIETARRALGRPLTFYLSPKRRTLRLLPHAFYGANAYFDPDINAILFGYFQADPDSPGPNIPSQTIFTCLSHDIIAHEVTHAIVHRLRPYFLEPSNVDVLAFHEAFSDIVALFQRFSYRELLIDYIQTSQGRLAESKMIVELAQQFGYATGSGKALRSAIHEILPGAVKTTLAKAVEPHARGAILVSAVFEGYFRTYNNKIADLIRIATGGSGQLPPGRLQQDLTNRLATEAAQLADRFLRMCFRAFDYMPPVDVTFGDFLRALITSDFELNPEDRDELRYALIEAFRERGIYPLGVQSLAEESLLWPNQINGPIPNLPKVVLDDARQILAYSASALDQTYSSRRRTDSSRKAEKRYEGSVIDKITEQPRSSENADQAAAVDEDQGEDQGAAAERKEVTELRNRIAKNLHKFAGENAKELGLDVEFGFAVSGFHSVHRVGADQRLVVELVAQFTQADESKKEEFCDLPLRAGATVIFGGEGEVRYIAAKPMPVSSLEFEQSDGEGDCDDFASKYELPDDLNELAKARVQAMAHCIEELDLRDPRMAIADDAYLANRMSIRAQFRSLHEDSDHG